MLDLFYQKTKITENSLRPAAILRLRFFSTVLLLLIPIFTLVKFTEVFSGLGHRFDIAISLIFLGCLIPMAFSRLANMMIFTDKRLDEWEIRLKKRAEAFGFRCVLFGMMALLLILSLLIKNEVLATRSFTYLELLFLPATIYFFLVALPISYAAWSQKPLID
ncbi:MAG: hypothetical protein ABJN69_06550 [Hellea sp.]